MKDGRYSPKPTNNNNLKIIFSMEKKKQWTCIQAAVALEKTNKYKSLLSFQDKNEGIFHHFFPQFFHSKPPLQSFSLTTKEHYKLHFCPV